MNRRCFICISILLTFGSLGLSKPNSQALLNVPINGFIFPAFDGSGNKIWEIRGDSVTMLKKDLLQIRSNKLICYSSGNSKVPGFIATSTNAMINPSRQEASGETKIEIVGQHFKIFANSWKFFGNSRKFVAKDNIKVFFDTDLAEVAQ